MSRKPPIDYPDNISSLSRDYYYQRISMEVFRARRRQIIEDMEQAFNKSLVAETHFSDDDKPIISNSIKSLTNS